MNIFEHHYTKQSIQGITIEAYRLAIPSTILNDERREDILATCYENLDALYTTLTEDKLISTVEKTSFLASVIFNIDQILTGNSPICQYLEQEQIVLTRAKDDLRTAAMIIIAIITDDNTQTYQFTSDIQLYEKSKNGYQLVDPFSDRF